MSNPVKQSGPVVRVESVAAEQDLAKAREGARRMATYLQRAIYVLQPVLVKGLGTWGVTKGGVLLADVDCLAKWPTGESATVYVHEAMHPLRDHHARAAAEGVFEPGGSPEVWNAAGADPEINDDIRELPGAKFPWPPCVPETYGFKPGNTAEAYYRAVMDKVRTEGIAVGLPLGNPQCGSGAGNPGPGEGEDDGSGRKALEEALDKEYGRTPTQQAKDRLIVSAAIQAAVERQRGTVPAGFARWAEVVRRPPQVSWQSELRGYTAHSITHRPGGGSPTFRKPNRRQAGIGYGVGKPLLYTTVRRRPNVWLALDTSGSMGETELAAGIAEMLNCLSAMGADATFLSCDADVHAVGRVHSPSDFVKLIKGGGGTDFRPVFALADEVKAGKHPFAFGNLEAPDLLVFYTDGYGTAPEVAPTGYNTLWLLSGDNTTLPAAWGKTVKIRL